MQVIRDTTNALYPIITRNNVTLGSIGCPFYELLLNCDVL